MFRQQASRQIRDADRQRGMIEYGGKNQPQGGTEADMAGRASADGGAEFAFFDKSEPKQRGKAVGDDGTPKLGLVLQLLPGRRRAGPHKVEQRGQAAMRGFAG